LICCSGFRQILDNLLPLIIAGQRTNEPKSEDAPNNVLSRYDRVEGDFGNLTIPTFTDWLDKNPPLKWGLAAAALGVAAVLEGGIQVTMFERSLLNLFPGCRAI